MWDHILLAVAIPLILIAVFLPPALLAGRFATLWDGISDEVKCRFRLSEEPASPARPYWEIAVVLLVLWPEEWLPSFRSMFIMVIMIVAFYRGVIRARLYLAILRARDEVPSALISYSRLCLGGLFLAGVLTLAVAGFCAGQAFFSWDKLS